MVTTRAEKPPTKWTTFFFVQLLLLFRLTLRLVGGDEYWIVFIEYPTAVVNSSELLQPAIITEKPGSGDCIDDHVEHRVHQEGLEVNPG